jgi:DMSO/TMAO reductase YedYZ molybdopterin-dependent catalytic subunit
MGNMSRRQFTRLAPGGIALSVLSGCVSEETAQATATLRQPFDSAQSRAQDTTPTPLPKATPSPTPSVTKVVSPGITPTPTLRQVQDITPSPTRLVLRNENRPGFFIRYYKPFEPVDPARWTLSVEGLVKKPQELTLLDVQSLSPVSQVSRMKCVECWSSGRNPPDHRR